MTAGSILSTAATDNGWTEGDKAEALETYAMVSGDAPEKVLEGVDTRGEHARFMDFLNARVVMGNAFDLDV